MLSEISILYLIRYATVILIVVSTLKDVFQQASNVERKIVAYSGLEPEISILLVQCSTN